MASSASTDAARLAWIRVRRHVDGIELDDEREGLLEDARPGEIRR